MKPIQDLRIMELADPFTSASLCGRLLADLGADVVMFEDSRLVSRSKGRRDGSKRDSYLFEFVAAGKRSALFDGENSHFSSPIFRDAMSCADVLLVDREGLSVLDGFGFALESISKEMPHLVVCCVTPFGMTGPLSKVPTTEITMQAMAGPMLANGYAEDPPLKAGIPIARCGTAILSALATMAGIYERCSSGLGQLIDMAEYDVLITLQGTLLPSYFLTGKPFVRIGNRHGMAAPWNAYETSDGWIVICTMGQSQWGALAKLIGYPDLVEDDRFLDAVLRVRNTVELDGYIESWTRSQTSADAVRALDEIGIPVGPIRRIDEVLKSPHTLFRKSIIRNGDTVIPGPILKIGQFVDDESFPIPDPGSSTRAWETGSKSDWRGKIATSGAEIYETAEDGNQPGGPLKGVKVLEVGSFTAGPLACRYLSMLGAEVLKVEPPKGEGSRQLAQRVGDAGYIYYLNNTDKYGCTLALDTSRGRDKFLALAKSSQALVTNLSTDQMERYQLEYSDLSRVNPELIYCAITGYGLSGPDGRRKAFDTVVQATSGIMALTGLAEEPPLKIAMSVADVMGACLGAAGVVAGLLKKLRTGKGDLVDAAMQDVAVWGTQEAWPEYLSGRSVPSRNGNKDYELCPNDCYQSSDRQVVISVQSESQWRSLLRLMGREDLLGDIRFLTSESRQVNSNAVDEIINGWTILHSSSEIVRNCWAEGLPAAVSAELGDVVNAAQTEIRNMILTQVHPKYGEIKVIGSPFKFSRTSANVMRMAPDLGQDNERFL